jgi:hypothetical protein
MSAGAITTAEVTQAFADATGEGGKFNGMTEKLADTMGGKLAIAMADLEKAGIQLGQAFAPTIMSITDGFEEGSSIINFVIGAVEKLSDGMGFLIALSKDYAGALAAIFRGDFLEALATPLNMDATNKFLDSLDERDRKREQAMNDAATAFDEAAAAGAGVSRDGVDEVNASFDETIRKIKQQIDAMGLTEEAARELELRAEGYNEEQIKQITAQEKILDGLKEQQKIEEDLAKQRTKEAEELARQLEEVDRAFTSEVSSTMAAVEAYYEQQRQANEKRRQDVSAGPGAGMDADSAASAKFMADQVNRSIGAAAVPDLPTPGEKEIADKTKELLLAQRESNRKQEEQLLATKELLAEFKENKFTRIR